MSERPDAGITRALERIHAAPGAPHTVASLARVAGASRAAFVRRFVAVTGVSPMRYVTERRLAIAAERLTEDDAPLAAIAIDVGYGTEFALSRAFKRHFGVAPGQFRRAARMTAVFRAAALSGCYGFGCANRNVSASSTSGCDGMCPAFVSVSFVW